MELGRKLIVAEFGGEKKMMTFFERLTRRIPLQGGSAGTIDAQVRSQNSCGSRVCSRDNIVDVYRNLSAFEVLLSLLQWLTQRLPMILHGTGVDCQGLISHSLMGFAFCRSGVRPYAKCNCHHN